MAPRTKTNQYRVIEYYRSFVVGLVFAALSIVAFSVMSQISI